MRTLRLSAALTAGLSVLAITTAQAQTPRAVTPGEVVRGDLTDRDLKNENAQPYDEYSLALKAGEGVVVTMDSDALDAFVQIGAGRGEDFNMLRMDDDSGGGERGLNARMRFRAAESQTYIIRAGTIAEDGRGAYTLAVTASAPAGAPKRIPLTIGAAPRTVEGALADGGARQDSDTNGLFDIYTMTLRKDDFVRIKMVSEYDNTLTMLKAADQEQVGFDDDSGGEGDAQLVFRAPANGAYELRAAAFDEAGAGAYTLTAEMLPPPPARPRITGIRKGQSIDGALTPGDAVRADTNYTLYDLYELRGRAGETVTITLKTPEGGFDPILAVGGLYAGHFAVIEENDDEAMPENSETANLNSKIVFTFKESGAVFLRATSLADATTGAYTIKVD